MGRPIRQVLRARYVLPISGPPLADAAITIEGARITDIAPATGLGPWTEVSRDVQPAHEGCFDWGNAAILPGLVNVHTHLEFSDLAHPLGTPGMPFVNWLRLVIAHRRQRTDESRQPVSQGLAESVRAGVTTLGEIATAWLQDSKLRKQIDKPPIDVTVFLELIGLGGESAERNLALGREHVEARWRAAGWRTGVSPHAPYSVHPELFAKTIDIAAAADVPVEFHLAESRDELRMLKDGDGPFVDWLEEFGVWNPTAIPKGSRPLDYLRKFARCQHGLVIHGNYLDDEEISFCAAHADRLTVVYCPRTHAFFEHAPHPLQRLIESGARAAIGTDSRASTPDLNLLAELRLVAERFPNLPSSRVLELGTIDGARAFGGDHQYGTLEPGKLANLAIVALPDHSGAFDPCEVVLNEDLPAIGTYYRGERIA